MKTTFDYHRANPQISTEAHVKSRLVELGRSLGNRIPIYLDTNFWVNFQKAALSESAPEDHRKLLRLLRDKAAKGLIFCPISESTFLELLKQSDAKSRLETAELIDELSRGVAMLDPQARAATELAHLVHSTVGDKDALHPLSHLVWFKVPYVLGLSHPSSSAFDEATQLVIQKAFFDEMWFIPLAKMVGMISDLPNAQELKLDDVAAMLNAGIADNADTIKSFQQVLDIEIQGAADVHADMLANIIHQMNPAPGGRAVVKGSAEWIEMRRMAYNLLFHTLKSNKDARRRLPSIYVQAGLHAAIRWDKRRRLTGNDLYDFNHATAALAHCRAFFTERPLHSLISAKNIALDKLFECQIISNTTDAITYLESLQETAGLPDADSGA